jgi:hypothetical protein
VVALAVGSFDDIQEALGGIYSRLGVPCRIRVLDAHNGPARIAADT